MEKYFRSNKLRFNWQLGLFLILLFGIPRFVLVMEANRTGGYGLISIIFLIMWLVPFVLLNKAGQKLIGIRKPRNYRWLLPSFLLGILACSFVFALGIYLYELQIENWFVYISKSYGGIPQESLSGNDKTIHFLVLVLTGMTFSPIGEELLYRGLIHQSFVPLFGDNKASIIDSLAFAVVHLAHFGLIFSTGGWKFVFIPAMIWMALMFFSSRLFFYCKKKANSIYGAIVCHAGFNFAMTYFIFYHIF
ncbi:MAG: CPBP family intramembrane glutamic endopeptidase [Eudoraea sp.]